MIPFFHQPQIDIGPVSIHAFGILVAIAVMVGSSVLVRRAELVGLQEADVGQFLTWILCSGFIGAHLFDRIAYFPREMIEDPISVLRLWQGLSSFGGFLGGTLGALLFFRRHAEKGTAWKYVDSFAFAFPFGWTFGRLGCFVAFDHPGRKTSFVLGEAYKDGFVRHNLGLYEAIYSMVLAAAFVVLGRRTHFTGFVVGVLLVAYAPLRFWLDLLRVDDARYLGFTPGQYGCVLLMGFGTAVLGLRRRRPESVPVAAKEPAKTGW